MSEPMPPAITPEAAFDMYRHLVEDNEQAVPILMAIAESGINAYVLEVDDDGIQPVLARLALKMAKEHDLPTRGHAHQRGMGALLRGRRRPTHPDGRRSSLDEAVIIGYADRAGNNWTAMRLFVRTNEGVRWKGEPMRCRGAGRRRPRHRHPQRDGRASGQDREEHHRKERIMSDTIPRRTRWTATTGVPRADRQGQRFASGHRAVPAGLLAVRADPGAVADAGVPRARHRRVVTRSWMDAATVHNCECRQMRPCLVR